MEPLKFKKFLVKKVWGGRKFSDNLGIELPDENLYGESWEVSARKEGMSYMLEGDMAGKSLIELLAKGGEKFLGKEVWKEFGGNFPLLIKYLDINDKLSVQVHPSDEYALRVEKDYGKSECWYIMEASPDAKLIMGMKDGVTQEIFKEKVERRDFSDLFNIVSVKKGDFIDVEPGVVHATLEGSILICETQQNSDTTYRIYDFDRMTDGKLRELHLDKAMDVIDFEKVPKISHEEDREKIALEGAVKEELIRCKYFKIDRFLIDGEFKDKIDKNFKIYSILDGEGSLNYAGKSYSLRKGDTYFIPAGLETSISGNVEILKSYL